MLMMQSAGTVQQIIYNILYNVIIYDIIYDIIYNKMYKNIICNKISMVSDSGFQHSHSDTPGRGSWYTTQHIGSMRAHEASNINPA